LTVEPAAADVGKEHTAYPSDNADRRQSRLDDRESKFGVGEDRLLTDELEVVVAPHFRVAAEIDEIRKVAEAVEPAETQRKNAVAGQPLVKADVGIESLT